MKKKSKQNTSQSGIALLLTIVIVSLVLLIGVLIANIVVAQLRLASDIMDSVAAIYAADSGIEWQLYQIRNGCPPNPDKCVLQPAMPNGVVIEETTVTGSAPHFTIRARGASKQVKREFEVNF